MEHVERISETERQLIYALFEHGYSNSDVALKMKLTLGTLEKARAAYKAQNSEEGDGHALEPLPKENPRPAEPHYFPSKLPTIPREPGQRRIPSELFKGLLKSY